MIKLIDIQSDTNWWISFGFHIDHYDPSITFHLPGIILYVGRCKQPGFRHSFRRTLHRISIFCMSYLGLYRNCHTGAVCHHRHQELLANCNSYSNKILCRVFHRCLAFCAPFFIWILSIPLIDLEKWELIKPNAASVARLRVTAC